MGTESDTYPRNRPGKPTLRVRSIFERHSRPSALLALALSLAGMVLCGSARAQIQPIQATAVPLLLPTGLAYDTQGDLYFAESGRNLIRKVAPDGTLTTFAGTGVQGFSGDGGPATAADFDSPQAVALDPAGNLLVADTHNHRIRRVDAGTGNVSTVAGGSNGVGTPIGLPTALAIDSSGNVFFADAATHRILRLDAASGALAVVAGDGTQGYAGDGGAATAASIDSPYGLALDAQGNLFLSDTHNDCVRRIDHLTGVITTVAGTGQPGFAGDSGLAELASLRLPRGLTIDSVGDLFLVDSANHRLRRIDAATGQITTVAGDGTQAYAGDTGQALAASLDSPRAVALSPAGLPTVSDSNNQRVRQVDSAQVIHTIAGLGSGAATATLSLSVPAVVSYGSGQATATLGGSPATGSVTFFDSVAGVATPRTIASTALVGNTATISLGTLAAGVHSLSAGYSGDPSHSQAQSAALPVTIAAAAATAAPNAVAMVYGTPVPQLSGSLSGVLPQDMQAVSLKLLSGASPVAAPGSYPIQAVLAGPAATNYALTSTAAAVVISKASTSTTLSQALAVHVASSTSGVPSGQVTLIDGATVVQTASLNASGDAAFLASSLSAGSHTLTAAYTGDLDFLAASSAPLLLSAGPGTAPDFALTTSGQTSATVPAGSAATFSFAVSPVQGALNSPIQLTASGLPPGASASFNPAYLPPSANPSAFILTIQTVHGANASGGSANATEMPASLPASVPFVLALGLPLLWLTRRRRLAIALACVLACTGGALLLGGCASRTNSSVAGASVQVYTVTVMGTATADSGTTLQHTAAVTLSVQ